MKKIFSIFSFILLSNLVTFAQNESDALLFSRTFHGGTARYMSMGGAFGALGANQSVQSTNPAGLALYRSSEVTFSPSISYNQASADYLGTTIEDYRYGFHFNNIGLVASYGGGEIQNGWKNINFGMTYNRIKDFQSRTHIKGTNPDNSMLDLFIGNSHGIHPDNLYDPEWLAWDSYAIDTLSDGLYNYYHDWENAYGQTQSKTIETFGRIGEYAFTFAGNYDDMLYVGATLGIQDIQMTKRTTHTETDENNISDWMHSFSYYEELKTSGVGLNFKFGMIYRPMDMIRIGAAIHTPTFYQLKEEFFNSVSTEFINSPANDGATEFTAESDINEFNYEITSPLKAIGSVAVIVRSVGLFSIDYEYADYNQMRMHADQYTFENENEAIQQLFGQSHSIRAGAEVLLGPLKLRTGYSIYTSPYNNETVLADVESYAAGLGLNSEYFFFDFAYTYTTSSGNDFLYETEDQTQLVADLTNQASKFIITLGFKF